MNKNTKTTLLLMVVTIVWGAIGYQVYLNYHPSQDEMLAASRKNFIEAEEMNPWFRTNFVDLRKGDALNLPVENNSIDVAAQNCLFNIFKSDDLKKAIAEMYRVLKPHGRLVMSDPTCEQPMNNKLRNDERLRALCLSGSLPLSLIHI